MESAESKAVGDAAQKLHRRMSMTEKLNGSHDSDKKGRKENNSERLKYIIEEPHLETHAIQILFIMMLFDTISNVHISGLSFMPLPFWMREPAWQTSGPPASDDPSARHIFVLYITDCIQAERFVSELEHGTVIHHLGRAVSW